MKVAFLAVVVVAGLGGAVAGVRGGPAKGDAALAEADRARRQARIPGGEFRPRKRVSLHAIAANGEARGWGLGDAGIKVDAAWAAGADTKGEGVKVAILDTGVDADHPELRGRVAAARDFTNSPSGTTDVQGHGTHCTGIVAMAENGQGYVGVAPRATIYSGKVLGDDGTGDFDWLRRGVEWAIEQKVDVISMSLGGASDLPPDQFYPALRAALKRAADAGIVVVAAAGNDGPGPNTTGYPGRYPEVVTVASSDINQNVSPFSSRGPEVDVAAPGDDIWSCLPNGRYAQWDGTSMATPCVAGVAALYVAGKKAQPAPDNRPSQDEFRAILQTTGTVTRSKTRPNTASGWGLIQAPAFVRSHGGGPPPPEPGGAIAFGKTDFTPDGWGKFQKAFPGVQSWTFEYAATPDPRRR